MRSRNQLVLPLNLEIKIDKNDPVRKLTKICDELDYTNLYASYLRSWRKIDPAVLFEILVFAYMNGIYSSRDTEKACKNDIRFMWLLQDEPVPDHSTFARFQNERLAGVIEELFYQLISKLHELGEISFKNIFIDGTKIEANANRYTFVWAKAVEKNLQKLRIKINQELDSLCEKYGLAKGSNLEEVIEFLSCSIRLLNIEFVHGRGKHKTQLQRDYEKLYSYLERIDNYNKSLEICGTRKSYSKTDTDATFMRMKEDHMLNVQLKPGYNVQIGVESEYIVGLGLFSNPTDTTTLIPFLERIRKNTGRKYRNIIADAGYASEKITHILNRKNKMRISSLPTMRLARNENTRMIYTAKRIFFTMKPEITLYVPTARNCSLLTKVKEKVRTDMKSPREITYVRTVQAVRTEKNATRENMKIER